jgi:alpha-beta hydrolase superfamily lysophospholipase
MVEHPARYDDFATFLNAHQISVYGIYHIGHGPDAAVLNHMGKGDFDRCVDHLHELVQLAAGETNAPVILLGHSMGSFLSQLYVTRYQDLAGLILSGSTKSSPVAKMGAAVAALLTALSKDKTRPSPFMNTMAFGSFNKAFSNARTDFDWLSRDEEQVDKYIADPFCGGICSISFYQNLTGGMAKMGKSELIRNVSRDLPIYIQGGSQDPVSEMGRGLYALRDQYVSLGLSRVELDVYEGARHEIFNETNRCEVYQNTLSFIDSIL